jgi:hypothetical protein
MKKLIGLLLAGLTISALVVGGCGSKPTEGDNATTPSTTATDKKDTTAPTTGGTPSTAGPATTGTTTPPGATTGGAPATTGK